METYAKKDGASALVEARHPLCHLRLHQFSLRKAEQPQEEPSNARKLIKKGQPVKTDIAT